METFYTLSPKDYIEATINADMHKEYDFFEPHLKPGCHILDAGFGSGRDMIYFNSKGYKTTGIDIEEDFVNIAREKGLHVKHVDILTYKPKEKYDAIWACASLIHASSEELPDVFNKLKEMITDDGVIYCSFKYGTWEGYIAEKYYTYLTEEKIKEFGLKLVDMHVSHDGLNRANDWISFIFKK